MPPSLPSAPRGTFQRLSRQLQTRRLASFSAPDSANNVPFPAGLFKPPSSVIKPWRCVTSAQEWSTSTYHYNKQTQKTLPVAQATADKLLRDYSTMIRSRGLGSTGSSGTARSAVAMRRKTFEKMYVSQTQVKDYGDRVVIDAFWYDAVEAEQKGRETAQKQRQEARRRGRAGGEGAGAGAGAAPRRPGLGRRRVPGVGVGVGAVRRAPARRPGFLRPTGAGR